MNIQKPVSQQLHDQHFGGNGNLELDPAVVARSFGVVLQPNQPLPETLFPLTHAEDDSGPLVDGLARQQEPKPSLLSLAMRRLQSLKPRNAARQQQLTEMIATMTAPLAELDDFVTALEAERREAIAIRREEIRKQGVEMLESLPGLEKTFADALHKANQSQEKKQQRAVDVQTYHERRRRISQWSSEDEIAAADERLMRAREALQEAAELALEDQRSLASAEAAIATVKANLATMNEERGRLKAELSGQPYFDPTTGLSTTPTYYRDQW